MCSKFLGKKTPATASNLETAGGQSDYADVSTSYVGRQLRLYMGFSWSSKLGYPCNYFPHLFPCVPCVFHGFPCVFHVFSTGFPQVFHGFSIASQAARFHRQTTKSAKSLLIWAVATWIQRSPMAIGEKIVVANGMVYGYHGMVIPKPYYC